MFTRKAVVDETFISYSLNVCQSIVGIDASQLYPFSMCQDMNRDCTQDGSLILICKNSRLEITYLTILRTW